MNDKLYYDTRDDLIDIDCSIQLYGTIDRNIQNASPGCRRSLDLLEFIYKTIKLTPDLIFELEKKVYSLTNHAGCNNDEMLAPCTIQQAWNWTYYMAHKFKRDDIEKFSVGKF